jgi:tetratricopeptide (TPR) repeat protein
MAAHDDLLVASGSCNAYSGVGDPYLPFREVLAMLTGDAEAAWAAGAITRDHALRLWAALPRTCQALLDHGPHVVPALIPGPPLLERAAAAAKPGATWLLQLRDRLERQRTAVEALEESDLFQQVTNLLCALAEDWPLLLVLDDLQWADTASAGLLLHLGRRLAGSRILVAGAYRPEEVIPRPASPRDPRTIPHPLRQVLAELQRQSGDIWLDLTEVPEAEGRHFVDSLLDAEPNHLDEGFRAELFTHAGGHPLFTVEVLRAMQERGDLLQDQAGAWVEGAALDWAKLPPRVEGIIQARIGRLDQGLQAFLSVASVEGETFTAQVAAQVMGVKEWQALRRLSQDLEAHHRLVREQPALVVGSRRLSRYRFAHALFQQHLYNGLGDGERAMLHAEIAGVLEALYVGRLDEAAVLLAHHYSQAGDGQRALKYFTLAGDVALASYANREAEGYYRRALALAQPAPKEAELLANLGESLARQSRFQEAIATWREGIERYQALEEGDAVARLYARSAWAARQDFDPQGALKLCLEGLARAGEGPDGPGLARLLHETARAYQVVALREKGEPHARQALEMAERLGDVELQALTLATWSTFPVLSIQESMALATRAVELAETNGLLLAGQYAHRTLAYRSSALGDYPAVREHFRRGAELAREAGLTVSQSNMLESLAWFGLQYAEFGEVEQALTEARLLLEDLDGPTVAGAEILGTEVYYQVYRGQWTASTKEARAMCASLREQGAERELARISFGLGLAILESRWLGTAPYAGEWHEAEAALAEATELLDRSLSPQHGIQTRVLWGILCLCQGRLADARRLLAEANQAATVLPCAPWIEGYRRWLAAQVAAAGGEWAEAMHEFGSACKSFGDVGHRWYCARVRLDWAEAHASRGETGDRQRAAALLREAQEAFRDMGVPRYTAIAQERLGAIGAASTITAE